jgi:hypothetical protein
VINIPYLDRRKFTFDIFENGIDVVGAELLGDEAVEAID